ncbi:MAG: TIGR02449 family protein [Pseudomonas sp.]
MEDTDLHTLTAKIDLLIRRIEELKTDQRVRLTNEQAWRAERAQLIEKNEMARQQVQSMILRLKALEQN